MTRAVLFASSGAQPERATAAALLPLDGGTVIGRLRDELRSLGITEIVALARPEHAAAVRAEGLTVRECAGLAEELAAVADLAAQAGEPLLLCAGDLVVSRTSLGAVMVGAGKGTALTVRAPSGGDLPPLQPPIASIRGRLFRVELTGGEQPPRKLFGGVIAASAERVRATADAVAAEAADAPAGVDALGLLLRHMVVTGPVLFAQRTRGLPSARVADAASAAAVSAALREIDEDDVRLRLAVKRRDDFFATYFVSPFSPRLVRWAARIGLAPTTVTWMSVAVAAVAALGFAQGSRPWLVAGAALLYVAFVLDCMDGQLARYLQRYARYGGWLDTICDRGKEYLVYAGLAVGAARSDVGGVWPLALAAMVLLTTRHMTDTWYGAVQDQAVERRARPQLAAPPAVAAPAVPDPGASVPAPAPRGVARLGAALSAASRRVQGRREGFLYWAKRTIPLPIGERWLVIGLTAALFNARVTFLALLAWGGFAVAYTLFGRTLQTQHLRVPVLAIPEKGLYRDDGLLARALGRLARFPIAPLPAAALPTLVAAAGVALLLFGVPVTVGQVAAVAAISAVVSGLAAGQPHDGPLDWLVPAALRISEYAVLMLLGEHAAVPTPVAYALIGVLVISHYDLTARLERSSSPVRWRGLMLGWDGRIAVLGVATLLGVAAPAFLALAIGFGSLFVLSAVIGAATTPRRQDQAAPWNDPALHAKANQAY